jgi:hypothetical protein
MNDELAHDEWPIAPRRSFVQSSCRAALRQTTEPSWISAFMLVLRALIEDAPKWKR